MQMFDSDLQCQYNQIYAYLSFQDNMQYDLPAMIGGRLDPFDSFAPNLNPMSDSLILYCKLNVAPISKFPYALLLANLKITSPLPNIPLICADTSSCNEIQIIKSSP